MKKFTDTPRILVLSLFLSAGLPVVAFAAVTATATASNISPSRETGHIWSEWVVDHEATCGHAGRRYRVCTRFPDSPHYEEQILPQKTTHTYEETVTAPTCTEPGVATYVCRACGNRYTEELPAIGHNYGAWTIVTQVSSTEDGVMENICQNDAAHILRQTIPHFPLPEIRPISSIAAASSDQLNSMDIILSSMCMATISGFGWLIQRDLHVIDWDKKLKQKWLEKRAFE